LSALKQVQKQKRNRLIALTFASVLLLLVYGPLAQWFIAADRVLYDQLATHLPTVALDHAVIVSIDPAKINADEISDTYGQLITVLGQSNVKRIIMTQPPAVPEGGNVPGWAVAMNSIVSVYAPTRHRIADLAKRDGFVDLTADSDGVLRRSTLLQRHEGVMSPSLPLAIAFDNNDLSVSARMSSTDDAIFVSNYSALPRVEVADLLNEETYQ